METETARQARQVRPIIHPDATAVSSRQGDRRTGEFEQLAVGQASGAQLDPPDSCGREPADHLIQRPRIESQRVGNDIQPRDLEGPLLRARQLQPSGLVLGQKPLHESRRESSGLKD